MDKQHILAGCDISLLIKNMCEAAIKYNDGFAHLLQEKMLHPEENAFQQQLLVMKSFYNASQYLLSEPEKVLDQGFDLMRQYMDIYNEAMKSLLNTSTAPSSIEADNRFNDEAWQNHPLFKYVKNIYISNQKWIINILKQLDQIDPKDQHKVEFYTRQFMDAVCPTNFLFTNPAAIKETLASNGENLTKGADHFLEDIERSGNNFSIASTDLEAFEVGANIAVTPGKVVMQNGLMQLIQYSPSTKKVHKTPLIITPAWINKYYILDLQEKNSFVKWVVDQGYTVFMISWINPSTQHSKKSFEDYMLEGPLAAIECAKKITGEKKVNLVGYCLGGTLLAASIAYLKAKKQDIVSSATFLTTLVDFTNGGDLAVFIDEEQIQLLEARMSAKGYLSGAQMATTFSMLRANDMIWSYYVNNYLLGKDPMPFDILYWNSDSTKLPTAMHSFYLRNMYQKNTFKEPGGVSLGGQAIDLSKIDIPTYILAAKSDHIVPWTGAFAAMNIYSGDNRFVLSDSGHVAGVVNHPSRQKYCYWTNEKHKQPTMQPETWLEGSTQHQGSWWVDWAAWLSGKSGEEVAARVNNSKETIEEAPGSYVKVKD